MTNPFQEPPLYAPDTTEYILVEINARMVPIVIRALNRYKYPSKWASNYDYLTGVDEINKFQGALLTSTQSIVDAIDRVYRLLDTIHNGTVYTATGVPAVVSPAIPAAPPADIGQAPGLRRQLLDAQGELPGGWFGLGAQPATMADLVKAVRQGSTSEGENLLSKLDLLGDASDIGSLFNVVRGTISDGLEVGAEGGILTVLVASTMAQAAMAGLQAGQLDSAIAALQAINAKLAAEVPATSDGTVIGELNQVRELLTPEV